MSDPALQAVLDQIIKVGRYAAQPRPRQLSGRRPRQLKVYERQRKVERSI